jgi:His-Xaa-Ser system radical SAM maturase HxsC
MLTRSARSNKVIRGATSAPPRIVRLSTNAQRPDPLRKSEAFLSRSGELPEGFAWYVVLGGERPTEATVPANSAAIVLPSAFDYLGDGDVVRLTDRGDVTSLFQKAARHNAFLLTERCNHYCLMCSQPPRNVQDDWIFDDIMAAIPLIDRETVAISFTGGEPTLLGSRLTRLVRQCKSYLPTTGVHVLTNGRAFVDANYAGEFAELAHPDLMFGIPIYSDLSDVHDYVVQADGAFDETVRGVLNLKRHSLKVEIRVVIHKQTYERLPQLARFITRNLTFVDQVVWMGLEMTGFTRANIDALWIDPVEYQPQLVEAVQTLAAARMTTAVYNHQLCITDRALWRFATRSISDWKNEYMPECAGCTARSDCAGFFSSAKFRYSANIRPFG